MNITKKKEGSVMTIALEGRLDTTTAPQLDSELRSSLEGVKELIFDLSELSYISSAGLRVLLSAQKIMNRQGKMLIRGAGQAIMEIFDITGFVDILSFEA